MPAEVSTPKLRSLVTAEALDALTGGNDGPFVEQREGVYRASLILHAYYIFPLGLLIDELGGVLETAQRWRQQGAEGVDGKRWKGRKTPWSACSGCGFCVLLLSGQTLQSFTSPMQSMP